MVVNEKEYYVYETPETDTRIVDGQGPWSQRRQWCIEHCRGHWNYPGFGRFVFWDPQDYFWFLLRWS